MKKRQILAFTQRLDRVASEMQDNYTAFGVSRESALDFALQLDRVSDILEQDAGIEREAIVHQQDADEPYMGLFDVGGAIDGQSDADEASYMDLFKDDVEDQFSTPLHGESNDDLMGHDAGQDDDWYTEASNDDDWYTEASNDDDWYTEASQDDADDWYTGF